MTLPRAAAAAALAAVLAAAPARAQDATSDELRELAARAASEPAALAELRRIERVDGEPVDLERALADADGRTLERRLALLSEGAAPGPPAPPAAPAARAEARDILAERRFRGTELPRPFRRPLAWLGERLRPVADAFDRLAEAIPGGRPVLWGLIGGLVVALAALVAGRLARRRATAALERGRTGAGRAEPDVRGLEREADEAERRGELERALRLLFRAGLLRLDRARAIALDDSLTTGQLRGALRSPDFDRLARIHDEVAYGRRAPEPDDLASSRSAWREVLARTGAV